MNIDNIMMPINKKFLEVFKDFMDDSLRDKMRAHNVRQYYEGIINLFLSSKMQKYVVNDTPFENLTMKNKLKLLEKHYNYELTSEMRKIFDIGGNGSHIDGIVSREEVEEIIEDAKHFVEKIFILYFLEPEHNFGKENIYTIFSMLPLANRIYILEEIYKKIPNEIVVEKLSLAYVKNHNYTYSLEFLKNAKEKGIINEKFHSAQIDKLNDIKKYLPAVHNLNKYTLEEGNRMKSVNGENYLVFGYPSSKNIVETSKLVSKFKELFDESSESYPEFIRLFLCLMAIDSREYN